MGKTMGRYREIIVVSFVYLMIATGLTLQPGFQPNALAVQAGSTVLTFDAADESNYIQEDSSSGTVFSNGLVRLVWGFSIASGEVKIWDDDLVILGTGSDQYLMFPRCLSCPGTNNNVKLKYKDENTAGEPRWDNVSKTYDYTSWVGPAGNCTSNCAKANYPAFAWAEDLVYKGYTDWRLTAHDDVYNSSCSDIRQYLPMVYGDEQVLTSTERNATQRWDLNISPNLQQCSHGGASKTLPYYVRAVRDSDPTDIPPASLSSNTTTPYYITTGTGSQIDTSGWTGLTGITTTETTPAGTSIKYLVSFDGRSTWKYWSGSAWIGSSLANLQADGMSGSTLAAITEAQWNASGGFNPGTFDIAADLATTDPSQTPELDAITIQYTYVMGAIADSKIQTALDATNQAITDTGMEPVRGRGLPVDHLYKASVSLTTARAKLLLGDAENAFIRLGKAIRELKYACDANNPTGDIIRELVETPTILECTSDGQYASTGIDRTLLETAYDDTAALIDNPDPLWQDGALEALNRALHNLEVAVYKLDLGKIDEAFVYLGWAIGYLEKASSLGAPTDAIIQTVAGS